MGVIEEQQAREPHVLATTFLVLMSLPLLIALWYSAAYVFDFLSGGDITGSQAAAMAPTLAAGVGAIASYVMLKTRKHTTKQAWAWSVITIVLLLAAALPMLYSMSLVFNDQWCEYQPGGKGSMEPVDLEDIPRSCR
ncbi:hypothetical protein V6S67_19355 [Arthrobacter sp. Soc17.1.1.1]|uniref:hypothetical protein n=1 Tax=Arthrobacter sp. Soc17.1.1.1 TaxID=3121277 RepID=UPI002FE4507A